ncbi:MAG: hypothetical protein IJG84_12470 [Kiritimatiellae bacterium]|nr:hypothetical protein [Kiritimatiellia bacterium]
MTSDQLDMDEVLWESGYSRECARHPEISCRYEPCTIANGVRCCADCMMCVSPCGIAERGTKIER